MKLSETIEQDLGHSMKAGTSERTGVLRLIRSSIKNEQIKQGHELTDDEVLKVLQREAKQRRDSVAAYKQAERPELAEAEERELEIIGMYLPQPLSEDELKALIATVTSELSNPDISQMGQVIGAVMARAGARADGGTVSKLVRERLLDQK